VKILINQNGKLIGPFPLEEVRNMIYSASLQRSDLGCIEGSNDWMPVEKILNSVPPPGLTLAASGEAPPPAPIFKARTRIQMDQLRDSKENLALGFLFLASLPIWVAAIAAILILHGIGLMIVGSIVVFSVLVRILAELWVEAYLKTNAIRVSSMQLPELHQMVTICCDSLEIKEPAVYVVQHNVWNAFASKLAGKDVIVLFSGAIDSLLLKGNLRQVAWLLGHELGHHAAGHLSWKARLANIGAWFLWAKFWHMRRCEFTCDRIGLYCAGSLKDSQDALANATVGAQLANRLNIAEAEAQWNQHENDFFVKYRTLYSTHPQLLCRMEQLSRAAVELGIHG
jgi:Zn-dependent protease with chaperone function